MNKKCINLLAIILLFSLYSCSNKIDKIENKDTVIDSVSADNKQLNYFINTLSASMDSIFLQEGYLTNLTTTDGVPKPTRVQMLEKLSLFRQLIDRQKNNIEELQDSLRNASSESAKKINRIISFYKNSLNEKERIIAQLQEELNNKNADIARITQRVTSLSNDVSDLSVKNKEQEEIMKIQDNIINECYVLIGTKADLQEKGVISSSGFLKKKRLNVSNLNSELFDKVDIRQFTEVTIYGKNPIVLTQMPTNSYALEKVNKNTYILKILDPTSFWSVSNYLVIQYN